MKISKTNHPRTKHWLWTLIFTAVFFSFATAECRKKKPQPVSESPAAISSRPIPVYPCRVIRRFYHDPDAFTQGLVIQGNILYESTGIYGRSTVRRVDLESGDVLNSIPLSDSHFGEGLTLWKNRLVQLTWKSRIGFCYDKESLNLLFHFPYQSEGWGLTCDGVHLISSDGSSRLYFLDPETFSPIRDIEVKEGKIPVPYLNELEYVQGRIFSNLYLGDRIAVIDPAGGSISGWIDCSPLVRVNRDGNPEHVLNGIAYDQVSKRLFITGKCWNTLYQIALPDLPEK